ncbi:hypothetical protein J4558_09755 [Leptolyngbya sp. 15MV]|nr:hypothetical protein J4558_09755 [Leptolyngbya sp. 15MV]
MARLNSFSATLCLAAASSLAATPVAAAELPVSTTRSATAAAAPVLDSNDQNAQRSRWDRHRYRHRDRVSTGDVLAGVLIIGGIAAVASAASRSSRERDDYRYRDYRTDYRPYRGDSRSSDPRGIDNAVRLCVNEVERDARVDTVDGVERTGAGWRVTGSLFDGAGFTCRIGGNGRIEAVDFGRHGMGYDGAMDDGQWSDDRYRSAWASVDAQPAAEPLDGPLPPYPGGPIDGDFDDD